MPGERLLIVDENAAILEMLRKTFVNEGYAVTTARNGVAALTLPEERHVDLVLLNSRLGGNDGYSTAQRLRREPRMAAAALLLMIPEEETVPGQNQDLHGADGYLNVPCPSDRIVNKVRHLLEERRARQEAEGHLRAVAREHLDELVEIVVREQLEDKARQMLDDLSGGLVALLEVKAKEGLIARLEELSQEEGRETVQKMVQGAAETILEEVAQETVSRVVGNLLEQRMDSAVARFEAEDLPDAAGRAVQAALQERLEGIVEQTVTQAREVLVPDLSKDILTVVEHSAARILPRVAAEKLPSMLEIEAQKAVQAQLEKETREVVNREAKKVVEPVAAEMRRRITFIGVIQILLVLSAMAVSVWWTMLR